MVAALSIMLVVPAHAATNISITSATTTQGPVGTSVSVTMGGCSGCSGTGTINWDSPNQAVISGFTCGNGVIGTFNVPSGSIAGTHTLTLTGCGATGATTTFLVTASTLSLSPTSAQPGQTTTLSGSGYALSVSYSDCLSSSSISSGSCLAGSTSSFTSDSSGIIPASTTVTIPSGTAPASYWVLVYQSSTIFKSASFTVNPSTFTATFDASSINGASDVSSSATVLTVTYAGTDSSCTGGTTVTVTKSQLPYTTPGVITGKYVCYSYASSISSTSATKQYRWGTISTATGSASGQTGQSGSFSITSNSAVTASYVSQYQITFAVSPSGTGSTNPTGTSLWEDSGSLSITASPNSGFVFLSWSSSGSITFTSSTSASTTATISGSGTITANFGVTQPITISTGDSAASTTITVSGCNVSPTSVTSNGVQVSLSAIPSCSLTFTVPADGASSRYRFSNSGVPSTTWTVTTCSSDTCSPASNTVYRQFFDTLSYSITGGGSPSAPTFTALQVGSSVGQTLTTTPTKYWFDAGSSWSLSPNPLGGSTSSERWQTNSATSGTLSSSTVTTITVTFYHQYFATLQINANAQSNFDSGFTLSLTGTRFGSSGIGLCAITTTAAPTSSCQDWADSNGTVSFAASLAGTCTNCRWENQAGATTVVTISSASPSSVNYYKQWSTTVQITAAAPTTFDNGMTVAITATQRGSSISFCTITATASNTANCTGFIDNSGTATWAATSGSNPSNARWATGASGVVGSVISSQIVSGGTAVIDNYYKQLTNNYQATPLASFASTHWDSSQTIAVSGTVIGSPSTTGYCSLSTVSGSGATTSIACWFDYNKIVTVASPIGISSSEQWLASGSNTFQQSTGNNPDNVNFNDQFQISFAVSPAGTGTTTPSGTNIWENGGSLSISAAPNSGYYFSQWSSTGSITFVLSTSSSTTATVSGSGTITAIFVSTRPLSLDGHISASTGNSGGTSVSVTLTTTNPNDLIYACEYATNTGTLSISATGLTWTQRAVKTTTEKVVCWYAIASSSGTFTITFSDSSSTNLVGLAFAVTGVDINSPFDPNLGSAMTGSGNCSNCSPTVSVVTTNANDFVVGVIGGLSQQLSQGGSPWTSLDSQSNGSVGYTSADEYQIVSFTGTYSPFFTIGNNGASWVIVGDAFKRAPVVSVSCSPNSVDVGVGTICTVTLSPAATGDSVSFTGFGAGTPSASSCTTNVSGQCSVTYTPSSAAASTSQTIQASYSNNSGFTTLNVNAILTTGAITPNAPVIDIGQSITLTAHPSGGALPYVYQWFTGPDCATVISGQTSQTYSASPVANTTYSYRVTDAQSQSACSPADSVTVTEFITVSISCPSGTAGKPIICNSSASGGLSPYTFSWSATSGSPASGTGTSFTTTFSAKGVYTITVTTTDANGASSTASASVIVVPQPLVVTVSCPTSGLTAGKPFNCTVSATGGSTPYTGTGTKTVTQSTKGTFTESFTVTDANGASASGSASVTIAAQPLTVIVSCPGSGLTAGKPFSCTVSAVGGTAPYTGTGDFTVTQPVKGTFTELFSVTDANGGSASASATVTIAAQPIVVSATCPTSGLTIGKPFECTVSATGGTGPYLGTGTISRTEQVKGTFTEAFTVTDSNGASASGSATVTIASQPLVAIVDCGSNQTAGEPFGCTVSASGGSSPYSGIGLFPESEAVKGTYIFSFTVTDANGVTSQASATVEVSAQPLVVAVSCDSNATAGKPFNCTVSATGGTEPYNGTGKFSVIESVKGTFAESFSVTDANQVTATGSAVVTVAPQPLIVTVTCDSGATAGKPFSCTVSATGGTVPYTGTGTFSVTEPVKGTYTESFSVTDANGVSSSASASVVVDAQPLIASVSCPDSGVTAGKPFSCTVSATGGTSPYTGSGTFTLVEPVKGIRTESFNVGDANGASATAFAAVEVSPQPLVVTVTCAAGSTAGKPFNCTVSVAGGTAPYNGIGIFDRREWYHCYRLRQRYSCASATRCIG